MNSVPNSQPGPSEDNGGLPAAMRAALLREGNPLRAHPLVWDKVLGADYDPNQLDAPLHLNGFASYTFRASKWWGGWGGKVIDSRDAEREFGELLQRPGGYEQLALLESRLIRRLPLLRDELKSSLTDLARTISPNVQRKGEALVVDPDDVLIADDLLARIAQALTAVTDPSDRHDTNRLRSLLPHAVVIATNAARVRALRDKSYLSHRWTDRLDAAIERSGGELDVFFVDMLERSLDAAATFEIALSRWTSAWRVLGLYEVFGSAAIFGTPSGRSDASTDEGGAQGDVPYERAIIMARELLNVAAAGDPPDFDGGTDTGFLKWCGNVIGMSDGTARRVLETVWGS
ncbi:MAG: hypothetical protein ABJF88_01280 [Rhodothermales bacterium]